MAWGERPAVDDLGPVHAAMRWFRVQQYADVKRRLHPIQGEFAQQAGSLMMID